jgi:hypothetical protein
MASRVSRGSRADRGLFVDPYAILQRSTVSEFAIGPRASATVYAATYGNGVFKSTNGGRSWRAANAGMRYYYVMALEIDPRRPATLTPSTRPTTSTSSRAPTEA